MYKVVALIGESGSGKNTILNAVVSENLNPIISCTTRPPREDETDGKDYFFLSVEEFQDKLLNGELLEASFFRNWGYGTPISSLKEDKINIGVFNPDGIYNLIDRNNIDLMVFKIAAADKTRLLRQLNREENPDVAEIIRRYQKDKDDFARLHFDYIELKNEEADDKYRCANRILSEINYWAALGKND